MDTSDAEGGEGEVRGLVRSVAVRGVDSAASLSSSPLLLSPSPVSTAP
jgi:hypothetical protein